MKELYIKAHDELVGEYLEAHPDATDAEAYDKTADAVPQIVSDRLADMADMLRDRAK